MSSPIKPPQGNKPVPGAADTGSDPAVDPAFSKALDRADSAEGASASTIDQISADLESGSITVDTAIDRLVDASVGSDTAQTLSPAARNDLATMLRDALSTDPTFQTLFQQIQGGVPGASSE